MRRATRIKVPHPITFAVHSLAYPVSESIPSHCAATFGCSAMLRMEHQSLCDSSVAGSTILVGVLLFLLDRRGCYHVGEARYFQWTLTSREELPLASAGDVDSVGVCTFCPHSHPYCKHATGHLSQKSVSVKKWSPSTGEGICGWCSVW